MHLTIYECDEMENIKLDYPFRFKSWQKNNLGIC